VAILAASSALLAELSAYTAALSSLKGVYQAAVFQFT
jgi:hypothetical protein